jgi:hypothetical protein
LRALVIGGALAAALAAASACPDRPPGEWAAKVHEDFDDRVPGDVQGDFTGVPMNDAARRFAESWDVTRVNLLEHQCQPYNVAHIFRGPMQFRIWTEKDPATQSIIAYREYLGTYQQYRTIWMDNRPRPPDYGTRTWASRPASGTATSSRHDDVREFYRRSGIPSNDRTTLVEHYIRHGNLLSHDVITDPVYLWNRT